MHKLDLTNPLINSIYEIASTSYGVESLSNFLDKNDEMYPGIKLDRINDLLFAEVHLTIFNNVKAVEIIRSVQKALKKGLTEYKDLKSISVYCDHISSKNI